MSSVYALKPRFQAWLRPAVARLAAAGITANQVTLAAAGASMLLGVALYAAPNVPALWLLLPLFLFVRMALNAIDGMLAREHGQQSALGACLN
ncbi:MAG TPA: CDP-alcohol phosphatidyltransferase family protein, partial [Plasticicumulans sp.]|nr:CDP-alcohol phosphatidyltransferase family protein [Plasticicumulans sp.]